MHILYRPMVSPCEYYKRKLYYIVSERYRNNVEHKMDNLDPETNNRKATEMKPNVIDGINLLKSHLSVISLDLAVTAIS